MYLTIEELCFEFLTLQQCYELGLDCGEYVPEAPEQSYYELGLDCEECIPVRGELNEARQASLNELNDLLF